MKRLCRAAGALLLAAALSPAQDPAPVDWIRDHAIPLQTVLAGNDFADMQPLKAIVGNARVVALGEATHGSREFFQMKHRMLEFLVSEMGFTIFGLEAGMPEAARINEYVLTGAGDPKRLLNDLKLWPWYTEEVLDLVRWMRDYNASGRGPAQFTGIDVQWNDQAARNVHEFLAAAEPDYVPAVDALYAEAVRHTVYYQAGYAYTFLKLPAGARRLRVTAMVKTDKVARGGTGIYLWVANSSNAVVWGDSPQMRGVKGTSDWTRYEVDIALPPGSASTQFGPFHSGDGTAWFDSLTVEIDGAPYTLPADTGFENSAQGFTIGGAGYSVGLDSSVAYAGRKSFRSMYLGLSAPDTEAACRAVVEHMEASRDTYRARGMSEAAIDWSIQNAQIVVDAIRVSQDMYARDPAMARNVQWLLDHNPGSKIVVWAHNLHVASGGYEESPWVMGRRLREMYGPELVNFGFAFNQGGFQAMGIASLQEFTVDPAPEGTLDATLASTGLPILALPLRDAPPWLRETQHTRTITAGFSPEYNYFLPVRIADAFDAILFIDRTSRARPLQ